MLLCYIMSVLVNHGFSDSDRNLVLFRRKSIQLGFIFSKAVMIAAALRLKQQQKQNKLANQKQLK